VHVPLFADREQRIVQRQAVKVQVARTRKNRSQLLTVYRGILVVLTFALSADISAGRRRRHRGRRRRQWQRRSYRVHIWRAVGQFRRSVDGVGRLGDCNRRQKREQQGENRRNASAAAAGRRPSVSQLLASITPRHVSSVTRWRHILAAPC